MFKLAVSLVQQWPAAAAAFQLPNDIRVMQMGMYAIT